jgi:hypothetical protein
MSKTKVVCPSCSNTVELFRDKKGRIIIPALLGLGLAIAGAVIGTTIGLVTYGTAFPATLPLAGIGLLLGGGGGYIAADKFFDKFVCKECRKKITI